MDILIKSPKITRGKGLRSVKEVDVKETINDRNAAHTKLFDGYLSDQQQNKILIRKLVNHEYFSNLLRNKKELQVMSTLLLAKVLLFLDSKDDNLFSKDPKSEILSYLNNSPIKQSKVVVKRIGVDDNKEILDFFRYIRFMKILMDNNKTNKEAEEIRIWNKARNMEMIHPHSDEF